jgi:hypothetical protein
MDTIHMNTNNEIATMSLKDKLAQAARTWTKPAKKPTGKPSKFAEHLDTIRYLRSCRHMSYEQIAEFFNANGLTCSYLGLLHFAQKRGIGGIKKGTRNTRPDKMIQVS